MGCWRPGNHLLIIGFVFLGCPELGAQRPAVQSDGVFVEIGPPGAASSVIPAPGILRERLVRIDRDRLEAARAVAQAPVLRLNLFDDVMLDAVVDRTGPTSSGYWLSGRIDGWTPGTVTLVVNGDVIVGTVRAAGASYAIRSVGSSMYAIRQIDPTALPPLEDDSLLSSASPPPGAAGPQQPVRPPVSSVPAVGGLPPEDGSRIDVLVVYTPAARDAEGGRREIEALIDLFVVETNQAYADSGVVQRINLVRTPRQVAYVQRPLASDSDESVIMRHLLDPSDGHLDEVHAIRDQYAADLVQLIVSDVGFPYGGEAKRLQLSDPERSTRYAFGITRHDAGGSIFAHELGHAMGLNHDRYAERHDCCTVRHGREWNHPWPYSYGYVNQRAFEPDAPPARRWVTIMSYGTQCEDAGFRCDRVLRFSNPRLTHRGDPLGVPGDRPSTRVTGPADAGRSLNNTRRVVANFRVAPCLTGGTQVRLRASNGQYVVALGNGGGDVLANRPRPTAWTRFTVVDANGGCVESGDAVSLHTSDGFYLRARQGGGSTLDATAPRATPWARFTLHRRRPTARSARTVGGAVRSGDVLALQAPSGHYVWAEEGGGGSVRADRSGSARLWGTFKVTRVR